jgi:acetyl esterase
VAVRSYRPEGAQPEAVLPVLVYFHGGGWVIGDLDTHDVLCRQFANGAQCAVISVDYRKAPEHPFPAGLDDCFAVVKHVAAEAKALRIDGARIAVGGDSAGGNLAAAVTLLSREQGGPTLCYQLLVYPATDQLMSYPSIERNAEGYMLTKKAMQYFGGYYLPNEKDKHDWRASPLLAKSLAGLPRAFVLTAGFDPLVDEGKAYAERLAKEGVEVAYLDYPDMIHGFLLMGGVLDTAKEAVVDCASRLAAAFKDASR